MMRNNYISETRLVDTAARRLSHVLHIVRSHSCCGVVLIRRKLGTGQDAIGGADTEQAQHQTLRIL